MDQSTSRAPLMRISRYEDAAVCSSSFNTSANRASTPKKGLNRSSSSGALAKTPSKAKTPNSAGRFYLLIYSY